MKSAEEQLSISPHALRLAAESEPEILLRPAVAPVGPPSSISPSATTKRDSFSESCVVAEAGDAAWGSW